MKHERVSIKWKLFIYLLSFSAILLALLWIIQTVYLNDFYKLIKKNELENAEDNLVSVINKKEFSDAVNTISERYDICILVADSNGMEKYSSDIKRNCTIHKLNQSAIKDIFDETKKAGKSVEVKISGKKDEVSPNADSNNDKFTGMPNMPKFNASESVIKAKTVKLNDGSELVVILDSVITPVDATKHTIRIQLIYISVIMVMLSLLIAFLVSKRVSRSIIKINKSAKELAEGNYDVEFDGKDYREITELSDTLNQTAKQLGKADLLQKELIANVSHDLRTPLTMIAGYSEVMRDIPGENTPDNVQVIIDETKRLTTLVNDLLDISKIQAGVTCLETKEFDLTESIRSVIERYSKMVAPYSYIIDFDYSENVLVDADEFKIYQVIYNLVSNAVNYTGEDKKVTVKQSIIDNKVRIDVIDSGKGIPKDELVNVWERYYKVGKNHKRAVFGTGLGLSIVKNVLKMHNAEYGVVSEVGQGSDFWFKLEILEERSKEDAPKEY